MNKRLLIAVFMVLTCRAAQDPMKEDHNKHLSEYKILIGKEKIIPDRVVISKQCIQHIQNNINKFSWPATDYHAINTIYGDSCVVLSLNQEAFHKLIAFYQQGSRLYTKIDKSYVKEPIRVVKPNDSYCIKPAPDILQFWNMLKQGLIWHEKAPSVLLTIDIHDEYFIDDPNRYFIALLTRTRYFGGTLKPSMYAAKDSYAYNNPIFEYNNSEKINEDSVRFTEIDCAKILRNNNFEYPQDLYKNNPPALSVESARSILLTIENDCKIIWKIIKKGE